jgi:hypothetical protein
MDSGLIRIKRVQFNSRGSGGPKMNMEDEVGGYLLI